VDLPGHGHSPIDRTAQYMSSICAKASSAF
jgi:hypothetical protein